jgi:hypothetical protein
MPLKSKTILYFLLIIVNCARAEKNQGFLYQNEVINPACVALFNSSIADFPYVRSINLNNCQHSNAAFQRTLEGKDGSYYFYINDKNSIEGEYHYKVIGKTKDNTYVLSTHSSGGGTLISSDLLLLKLKKTKEYLYEQEVLHAKEITALDLIGYVSGGDRCVGDFAKVTVTENQLQVAQYQGNNPIDCKKTKAYSIDLEKLTKS